MCRGKAWPEPATTQAPGDRSRGRAARSFAACPCDVRRATFGASFAREPARQCEAPTVPPVGCAPLAGRCGAARFAVRLRRGRRRLVGRLRGTCACRRSGQGASAGSGSASRRGAGGCRGRGRRRRSSPPSARAGSAGSGCGSAKCASSPIFAPGAARGLVGDDVGREADRVLAVARRGPGRSSSRR